MRDARLFVDQPLGAGRQVVLDAAAGHYLTQVLRLRSGAKLAVFNGDGREFAARLLRAQRQAVTLELAGLLREEPPAALRPHLWLGLSRGERMDIALQKATELGVASITPLRLQRSVVQLDAPRTERKLAHWQGVVIHACEQSGRCRVPLLHAPAALDAVLGHRQGPGLLLDPQATTTLADLPAPGADVTLLIGPEGGLAADERLAALQAGFQAVRLGPRILRTETAPLAALAALQTLWGDFC